MGFGLYVTAKARPEIRSGSGSNFEKPLLSEIPRGGFRLKRSSHSDRHSFTLCVYGVALGSSGRTDVQQNGESENRTRNDNMPYYRSSLIVGVGSFGSVGMRF